MLFPHGEMITDFHLFCVHVCVFVFFNFSKMKMCVILQSEKIIVIKKIITKIKMIKTI